MLYLKNKLRQILNNKYKKFGLNRKQVKSFKKSREAKFLRINFKGELLEVSSPYWFLHSIDELFIDDIYRFKADNQKPLIIDCGANWGLSIIYFKEIYPEASIIAFEPDPSIFKLLVSNVQRRKLEDVELINKAVWNLNESLFFSSDNALGGTIANLGINTKQQVKVGAIRFKDFLSKYDNIDFLKIDIEGAEYEVLKDCQDSLNQVKNLFVEYHSNPLNPQCLDEILSFIRKAGFRVYIKEAWNNMSHPFVSNKNLYYDLQLNIFCYRV